ncbi:hypothetical protein [Actinokineospora sp. UTMC 2448]|uniref:hypothetical protein n=1 Tax=Actinokineospora sp. UTMC 2448 TaxID=2268449 RepID=UPI002164A824|nr:hypothetical protein [Actinokineospora sp. UTMC 2448]UVS80575.1 hypothetical protein Actkin_04326 [Actinokineospora sp. UTMC 2448]
MFDTLMGPLWCGVVIAASTVALAGCSSAVKGTAVPEAASRGERFEAFEAMRSIDPCALHSSEDAGRVSGLVADEIMPGPSLNTCRLELVKPTGDLPVWTVTVTAGVEFSTADRQRGQRRDIGSVSFWYMPRAVTSRDCAFVREFGPDMGIELQVVKRDAADRGNPCRVARDYLLAVGRWWVNPATRADRVSVPFLPVATVDPCSALDGIAARLDQPVDLAMSNPHSCELRSESGGGLLVVEYTVEPDPRVLLQSPSDYTAIEVAGRRGVLSHRPVSCHVRVPIDEPTLQADQTRSDAPHSYQVVTSRSSDCDLAKRGTEAALAAIP